MAVGWFNLTARIKNKLLFIYIVSSTMQEWHSKNTLIHCGKLTQLLLIVHSVIWQIVNFWFHALALKNKRYTVLRKAFVALQTLPVLIVRSTWPYGTMNYRQITTLTRRAAAKACAPRGPRFLNLRGRELFPRLSITFCAGVMCRMSQAAL